MKIFIFPAIVIAMLLTLAGCQATGDDLAGTSWQLSALNGAAALSGTSITLQFGDAKTASGSDGCNRYTTRYTVSGARLTFTQPMASSMMACSEEIMNQASAYQKALAETKRYTLKDNQLTLLNGQTILAVFGVNSQELTGTAWQVTGYNNGRQAVVGPLIGPTLTAKFSPDGQVSGDSGCNTYSGAYQTTGTKITIGPLLTTKTACSGPDGVMQQEKEFLAALQSAAVYRIDGANLELRTADDALAVFMIK
jgi:heat shock protein HslJ